MDQALFRDREEAGRRLAESYEGPAENVTLLGIARGGVPVGYPPAVELGGSLGVVTVRKLPIPSSPEMGFGAIAPDGSLVLNQPLVETLGLERRRIDGISERVLEEVRRREEVYGPYRAPEDLTGQNVVLTDDGLATGYTMIAAIRMARKKGAASVSVAVPVSPADTARKVQPMVDYLQVLHASGKRPFAVASFYEDFHDLRDREVLDYLEKARREASG